MAGLGAILAVIAVSFGVAVAVPHLEAKGYRRTAVSLVLAYLILWVPVVGLVVTHGQR
jgi:hypothetical protein